MSVSANYLALARIEGFLTESARKFPHKTAFIQQKNQLTYAELDRKSENFAQHLRSSGLQRGDRVLIFLPNCLEVVIGIFGILKAGGVFSTINPGTKAEKLRYIEQNSEAAFLVTNGALVRIASETSLASERIYVTGAAVKDAPYLAFEDALQDNLSNEPLPVGGIDTDLAMLVYTSGSTGVPKGVMMQHRNICFAANSINTYLRNTSDEVIMLTLPISFDYGLYQVFLATQLGATVVLEQGFTFPAAILNSAREHQVTNFPMVPTMAALLISMKNLSTDGLDSLRCFTNTGAALPPEHIKKLKTLFPKAVMYSMYGLTECKRCTYIEPDELEQRPDSVGKAIPYTEVFIVDKQDKILGAGETGELVIRGSHVMSGYWKNPQATAKAIRPHPLYNWEKVLYSGDLFRQDEAGYLYFIARKDDIIKSRGEKISPKEIENVLYALANVKEAIIIGIPDEILGHTLKAIIVPVDETLTEREVIAHCRAQLEPYMVPQQVEFRSILNKTASGKIDRTHVTSTHHTKQNQLSI